MRFLKRLQITFMFLMLVLTATTGHCWDEFAVLSNNAQSQQKPDIFGTVIVWQQLVSGDFDIYAADIDDLGNIQQVTVANFDNDQNNPAVYGNKIVWQDCLFQDW